MTREEAARALVAHVATAAELHASVTACDQRIARAQTDAAAWEPDLQELEHILKTERVDAAKWLEAHRRHELLVLTYREHRDAIAAGVAAKTVAVEAAKEQALTIAQLLLSNGSLMDHIKDLACAPE